MELARFPSRGGFSVRSIFTFVLAVIAAALLMATLAPGAKADAADAHWNGDALVYNGNQYISAGEAQKGDSTQLPENSPYYVYITPAPANGVASSQKAYILYFAPGTSPPSATSATYVEYDYAPTSKTFANPSNQQTIAINASNNTTASSCNIEGIGWIACPAMTWLANGMDFVFGVIADFMKVQPLQTGNTNGTLYTAWSVMRSIANIAFIIGFIIIIYAQLTNTNVSKYGLKTLLPRLVIVAVGVNLSYFIAALAIDISNVLGYSIQSVFMQIQQTLVNSGSASSSAGASINGAASWGSFTTFILSGGTAAVVGVNAAIAATGGIVAAAGYILLPILLGLLLALVVVFLILAARQAIIIILVIIAPLAIVAYLLPNTEKWFEKWRSLFMTMLIFFPAFAVVFGGSQIAGAVIIQNATSVTMQLLGMAVQVAPLVITPLLLKLSGSLLANIARIVNNPNKGMVDRTRKWANERAEWHRQRGIGNLDRFGNPLERPTRNPFRKAAQNMDQRKKRLSDRTGNAGTAAQTLYENSSVYAKKDRRGNVKYDMAMQKAYFEDKKSATHAHHEAHVNDARRREGTLVFQSGIDAREAKDMATASQNYTEAFYNNARRDKKLANGALYASGYKVELSKAKLERTENLKQAFYDNERATAGTDLYASAVQLETSKFKAEGAKNNYTKVIDELKVRQPESKLSVAAQYAQSSKDHADGAQQELQAFFDAQRKVSGTLLNTSTIRVENSKSLAEQMKTELTSYLADQRSDTGGSLRAQTIKTESAKHTQQNAEARLSRIIDEFKAGGAKDEAGNTIIDGDVVSQAEADLARSMLTVTENLSAEKQGISAAQSEQRQRVSQLLGAEEGSADWARAQELLTIAGSIDENGSQRALANALAERSRNRKEVLTNIQSIFNYRNFTDEQIRTLAQGDEIPGIQRTQDTIAAAVQTIFSGGNTNEIVNLMKNIDFSFPGMSDDEREEIQIIASDALMSNGVRPPFMTVGFTKMLKSGIRFDGEAFEGKLGEAAPGDPDPNNTPFNQMIVTAINAGKIDSKKLQAAGKDNTQAIFEAMEALPKYISPSAKAKLLAELAKTLDPKREASEGLADSVEFLQGMVSSLGGRVLKDGSVELNADGTPKTK